MLIISITISAIAILLSIWLGRRNPVRSSGLTSGMLVLLMLTPLLLVLPRVEVSWMESDLLANSSLRADTVIAEQSTATSYWLWSLSGLWIIGSVLFTTRLLLQCYQLKQWCKSAEVSASAKDLALIEQCAEQLKLSKLPEIRYTSKLHSPVITGLIKPVLLLPRSSSEWSKETLRMVMLHELGHYQRKDLWMNMAAHLACAFHWFNPLVWMLRKRLLSECEYACDAHVIAHGANTKTYIHALCDVAENCRKIAANQFPQKTPATALAMANDASLKNRVANVLDHKPVNSKWMVASILLLSASAALAITVLKPQTFDLIDSLESEDSTEAQAEVDYTPEEVKKRLSANPFPAN